MPTGKIAARLGVINSESSRPFVNAFKQAWSWQSDRGGLQWDALVAAGHMTAGGRLISIPPNSGGFRTRVFHNMPAQAGGTGRWRLRWQSLRLHILRPFRHPTSLVIIARTIQKCN